MKQKLPYGLIAVALTLALAPAAFSQPASLWENWSSIVCPPEIAPTIDAVNFANYGQVVINITNYPPFNPSQGPVDPFQTFDTLNFTNAYGAFLACNSGFLMQYNPSQSGSSQSAASFYNAGTINCGTLDMTNLAYLTWRGNSYYTNPAPAVFLLTATNIVSPGVVNMGPESRLSFKGDNLDLTRAVISLQNTGTNTVYDSTAFVGGIFDGYWGVGTNIFNPVTNLAGPAPRSFAHYVTNRTYAVFPQTLVASNAPIYFQQDITFGGSNIFNRIVYLVNTNAGFPAQVFFPATFGFPIWYEPDALPDIVLQWSAPVTNEVGSISTNYLYLFDSYAVDLAGQFDPRASLWPWLANPGSGQTFVPINYLPFNPIYQVFYGNFWFLLPSAYGFFVAKSPINEFGPPAAPTVLPPNLFFNVSAVANYAAYEGIFSPGSVLLTDVAGRSVTNLPGRVDLTASQQLDLTRAQITSLNSLVLRATNHFVGSAGARIISPYVDINLRSTNGAMAITNLIEPVVPMPVGICDLCSIRWTNLLRIGQDTYITNGYHVVFVDARIAPYGRPFVQSLTLRSTNTATLDDSMVINDFLTVTTNLLLDTRRLTIATNDAAAMTPVGGFNLVGVNILWSSATPRLQYLTNYGIIQAANSIFFGGSRTSPYYTSNFTEPYYVFVNHGGITNFGSQIWALDFRNSGVFSASAGAIRLQQATNAVLTGGAFLAPGNLISIESASLLVSNHTLLAGGSLTLAVTNYLDDGSLTNSVDVITNKNIWNAGFGINLPILPPRASLLATTITNIAGPSVTAINRWAGRDYGCRPDGFVNNAALGRLILAGNTGNSLFTFLRTTNFNALYVDLLELKGATASADGNGNFAGVNLETNFTIYYGDAVWNGMSIAEQLNGRYGASGASGGRFCWVSNYHTGFFSSTNYTYTDGSVHRLNRALRTSCNIDSDGDGWPNCADGDPVPVLTPTTLALSAAYTSQPARSVVLSWNTIPLTTNYLYASTNLLRPTTNWDLITQFVSDATIGSRVSVTNPVGTNRQRYYRVRVLSP